MGRYVGDIPQVPPRYTSRPCILESRLLNFADSTCTCIRDGHAASPGRSLQAVLDALPCVDHVVSLTVFGALSCAVTRCDARPVAAPVLDTRWSHACAGEE